MNRTPRRNVGGGNEGSQSAHIASSFTDLMASLMVIFILLFMATLSNAVAIRNNARDTTIETLLGALKSALAAGGMDEGGVRKDDRDPYAVVIVMPEDLLFKRGDWNVGEGGQRFLRGMIPLLSDIVCIGDLKAKVSNVVVEGHTDTTWSVVGAGGADGPQLNLELSQKRSMDVVRWSLAALEPGDERDCFRRLLSASGRGQEELLSEVAGDDSRQRRVVFKIRTQRDAADDLATGLVNTVASPSIQTGKR
jgi:outer membrane protein OmpA-like peptidoglycan-associated protein